MPRLTFSEPLRMPCRRHFLLHAAAASAAFVAPSALWAQAAPGLGAPTLPSPGFRRMKLGDAEVIALNDGVTRRPLSEEFVRNAPLAEVKALLAAQGLSTDYLDVPYTAFLLVAGGRRVLFDAGFADNGPATAGRLLANLQAAGLSAEAVDTVVISHFHGDHIQGLRRKDGTLSFPKATVLVPAPEHAFWMDDAVMNARPEGQRGAFQVARRVFGGMGPEQLRRFTPGDELLPGLRSVAAFGHTPGHTLFEFRSGGQAFHYVADLTNVPALFVRKPEWQVQFDMDAPAAARVRRETLQRLVASGGLVGGYHFPFPAFGRVVAEGEGFAFQPQG
jgi:glyoxylase-like metal-dependent hydrolase (beta-lactamase superfamily II)